MVDLPLPASRPIDSLSPSSFETLRLCCLRFAFGQHRHGHRPPRSAQQVLGDLCHAVLEELVRSDAIRRDDWVDAVDRLWPSIAERMAHALQTEPHEGSLGREPASWPGYAMKRARLRKAARRLHDLLASVGDGAELISETPLRTTDGRLQGRPDLIVRDVDETWVVDYKSGAVLEEDGCTPREAYVRQLHLYALLEAAVSERWPTRAFLVPLNGPIVEVPVVQAAATSLGEEARHAIERFNAVAPAAQPATCSPQNCGYCPWITSCPTFWQVADPDWEGSLAAARGVVRSAEHSHFGGVTLVVEVAGGSVHADVIAVRNVSPIEHPAAAQIKAGDALALAGLRALHHDGEFALPAWGQLAIWGPGP